MKLNLPRFRRSTLAFAALVALAPAHAVDYNWSSGTFVSGVTAPNPLGPADTLNILGGGAFDGAGFVFTNGGTVNWNSSPDWLPLANGAAVVNNGLWNSASNNSLVSSGAPGSFTNNGIFRNSAGVVTTISAPFINNGTIDVQSGEVRIESGATFNAGSVFAGAGRVDVRSNSSFIGAFTSTSLVLNGAGVTFTGQAAQINGVMTFAVGTLAGSWEVAAGATLVSDRLFGSVQGNLVNNGTVDARGGFWQSGGSFTNNGLLTGSWVSNWITIGETATFTNSATGTVRAGDYMPINAINGGRFVNNGGQLVAEAGASLAIIGDGNQFNGGTYSGAGYVHVNGNALFSGVLLSSNLALLSGTQTGANAVLDGTLLWAGGHLQGTWQLAAGSTITANGGIGARSIVGNGTVVDNQGMLVWSGLMNPLTLDGNARLHNAGTFDIRTDGVAVAPGGAGAPVFINTGLVVKSAGAGTASIQAGVGFDNQGTLDVRSGTLALPANFVNNGAMKGTGTYSVGGAALTNAGVVAPGVSPGPSLGTLALSGNFVQAASGIFAVDLESLSSHDLFNVSGSAALGGTLALSCFASCSFAVGDVVTILDSIGDLSGTFSGGVTLNGFGTGAFNVVYDTVADRVQLLVTQAPGPVPVPGNSYTWSVGTFASGVTAPNPLAANDTLNIVTGGFKFLNSTVFTNAGEVKWSATDGLYMQNGAGVVNNGRWDSTTDHTLVNNGGGNLSFVNNGTFRKSGGAGSTTISNGVGFVNNGTIDAQTGSIRFIGGSVFNNGSVFTGAGSVVAAGNNTFNGSFTSANLVLESGIHRGGAAVVGGVAKWTGGTLAGSWTVAAGQTLEGQSGTFKFIDGAITVVTNQGTLAWNTSNFLYMQNGGTLRNEALFVANQSMTVANIGGAMPIFDNTASGTVRAAAGTVLIFAAGSGLLVNNGGTLDALAGATIHYAGGSVFNTGSVFTGAGRNLAAGNNSFNGSFTSANLVLHSGIHRGGAAVVGGVAAWAGGTLAGTWTVAAGQTLQVKAGGGDFKFIDGAATIVTNNGTLAVDTTSPVFMSAGSTLANLGQLNFSTDGTVFYSGGALPSFINTGLIVKSGGSGNSSIGDSLRFDNRGTIDVQSGTIMLPTGFTNNGVLKGTGRYGVSGVLTNAGTVAAGASPGTLGLTGNYAQAAAGVFAVDLESRSSHDLFNISGSAALNGTLAISCFAACSLAVGDVVTILDSAGDLSGSFASVTLSGFATGAFSVVYDTAADRVQLLVTQAVTAVPEPGSYALMLAGIAVLGGLAQHRRRRCPG